MSVKAKVDQLWTDIQARDPDQKEFLQAVHEVMFSLVPLFEQDPKYIELFRRLVEPERQLVFRVAWEDDKGNIQVNRGYRVQFSQVLGPYKGGCRFHPSVNLSIVKFLGFEQTFKNSLTTLAMGAGKGGSDFDPKGKSDAEVMRFCQSFMVELNNHIGPDRDVPAGDIGVGGREIGFMFGAYRRLKRSFEGVLTGKDTKWGGSLIRPEATGYGAVYFAQSMCEWSNQTLKGQSCTVSGSGNAAQYTIEKLLDLGAVPITASDSGGYIYKASGLTRADLAEIMRLKNVARARISEMLKFDNSIQYVPNKRPWEQPCFAAFPSATQNEIDENDAKALVAGGCKVVSEAANMPSTTPAIEVYHKNKILFGPGKAANAGGVAVSGLEMAQNSQRIAWTREEVDSKLKDIMKNIFENCATWSKKVGHEGNFQMGANIAGFVKVADSMAEQGSW